MGLRHGKELVESALARLDPLTHGGYVGVDWDSKDLSGLAYKKGQLDTVIAMVVVGGEAGAAKGVGAAAAETATLDDAAIVIRGGTGEIPAPGEVFSGAYGSTLEDAAKATPYGTIRVTTAGEIRDAGGTVNVVPELTRGGTLNEQHVDICLGGGACPFGPQQPNPVPKAGRIQ
jgi:hypothetical protein